MPVEKLDVVLLVVPENPKFNGLIGVVVRPMDWGAFVKVSAWVPGTERAAASYRAGHDEMVKIGRIPADWPHDGVGERSPAPVAQPAPVVVRTVATGHYCPRCGGMLVQTGSCRTCQGCGANEGCG